jgi:hypothetical protein
MYGQREFYGLFFVLLGGFMKSKTSNVFRILVNIFITMMVIFVISCDNESSNEEINEEIIEETINPEIIPDGFMARTGRIYDLPYYAVWMLGDMYLIELKYDEALNILQARYGEPDSGNSLIEGIIGGEYAKNYFVVLGVAPRQGFGLIKLPENTGKWWDF